MTCDTPKKLFHLENFYCPVRLSAWLWNLEFAPKIGIQKLLSCFCMYYVITQVNTPFWCNFSRFGPYFTLLMHILCIFGQAEIKQSPNHPIKNRHFTTILRKILTTRYNFVFFTCCTTWSECHWSADQPSCEIWNVVQKIDTKSAIHISRNAMLTQFLALFSKSGISLFWKCNKNDNNNIFSLLKETPTSILQKPKTKNMHTCSTEEGSWRNYFQKGEQIIFKRVLFAIFRQLKLIFTPAKKVRRETSSRTPVRILRNHAGYQKKKKKKPHQHMAPILMIIFPPCHFLWLPPTVRKTPKSALKRKFGLLKVRRKVIFSKFKKNL